MKHSQRIDSKRQVLFNVEEKLSKASQKDRNLEKRKMRQHWFRTQFLKSFMSVVLSTQRKVHLHDVYNNRVCHVFLSFNDLSMKSHSMLNSTSLL